MMRSRAGQLMIDGEVVVRVHGTWPFRVSEVRDGSTTLVTMGPRSWLSIYIGRGQWVRLADGRTGRIVGTGMANWIIPVLVDDRRNTVARATPGEHGVYLVDTVDESYRLVPSEPRTWRSKPRDWELRSWDAPVARIRTDPERIITDVPVPLAAVLVAFTVIDLGIPGEHSMGVPRLGW